MKANTIIFFLILFGALAFFFYPGWKYPFDPGNRASKASRASVYASSTPVCECKGGFDPGKGSEDRCFQVEGFACGQTVTGLGKRIGCRCCAIDASHRVICD